VLIPVLLSGGVGSRLWPVSRQLYPKQFLKLADDRHSLFQQTCLRAMRVCGAEHGIVVCNEEHRFIVAEQLRQLGEHQGSIILEPIGRNTAPALTLAALDALQRNHDAMMLVLPADHVITDIDAFADAVSAGIGHAKDGLLVTFGIVPSDPETGYGYIRRGERIDERAFRVTHFAEKPDRSTAEHYLSSGEYDWNSGMFLFRAETFLDEIARFEPEVLRNCREAYLQAEADLDFQRIETKAFARCPSISIDYAVMERTSRAAVVPLQCGWSDVGSWGALQQIDEADSDGNVCHGDVVAVDSDNCYLRAESRLLSTLGVSNLVVVETPDAVLVADRESSQDVKKIVDILGKGARAEVLSHTKVYRPWGSYESLVQAPRFQVKRIIVNPGQQLSLQMHHHRAEHWIVVHGTARVTCGEKEFTISEDESTYIPLGTRHRLANPGVIPLELIEVQSGSYLGEDDIVRFQDVYGRSGAPPAGG
jgi:mannose-1-phosphate guanylyltransferase/mannose-6-phosphate isomerase